MVGEGHHQKLGPCLCKGLTEDGSDAKYATEEESATAAEEVVQRVGNPAAHETRSNVRAEVVVVRDEKVGGQEKEAP